MIGRGCEPLRSRRGRRDANSLSFSSPDSGYSLGLSQVLVGEESVFRNTRSKIAIPYNYKQPSSSIGVMSPELLKSLFQWSDDKGEASGYASSAKVSSVQIGRILVHMVDDSNDDLRRRIEAQEQTSKAQEKALDNIQQMLTQLLTNRNNNDIGSNHNEEEHNDDEQHKTEKSKESSSIDAKVLKGMQAQITSLAQRDELKKAGMIRPYPLEWDSVPCPLKFKPPTLHTYDGKSSPNQHIYYFRSQTSNVIDNDAIVARLFIGTLKGVAFDWFRSLPPGSINS